MHIAAIGSPDFSADDVQEWLDAPFTTPDADGWTVRDEQGRLVAWAYIDSSYGERGEDGTIYLHPEANRALYRPLVDLLVHRSAERAAAAGRADHDLVFWCTNEPVLAQTVAAIGARKARSGCARPGEVTASPACCSTRRSLAFHARGFTWAGLGVDLQNETGAYRLYESVGMRVQYTADAWELVVPAAARKLDAAGVGGSE